MGLEISVKNSEYYPDRREMLKYIPINASYVLDIGCGDGSFGRLIKSILPAEIWGVEIDSVVAERAKSYLDNVFVANLEHDDLDIFHDRFDCIVLNDVLEHLIDPWTLLRKIKKYLTVDGRLVLSIPNVRYYDNLKKLILHNQWKYEKWGINDITHLRYFTKKSIVDTLNECGYKIECIVGLNYANIPFIMKIINLLGNKMFDDVKYLQFACVAIKST